MDGYGDTEVPKRRTRRRKGEDDTDEFFTRDEPHSKVKRSLFRQILLSWLARILQQRGGFKKTEEDKYEVTIVDGFAGAGKFSKTPFIPKRFKSDNEELSFGSPIIALTAIKIMMMRLKKNHAGKSSEKGYLEDSDDDIKVARFIFCDSNKRHMKSLKEMVRQWLGTDGWTRDEQSTEDKDCWRMPYGEARLEIVIHFVTSTFADVDVASICHKKEPIFAFLDPYGYSSIPLKAIKRLFANDKNYVLVNLMVSSAYRFRNVHPHHITALFGQEKDFDFAQDTSSNEKLRIIADDYRETLKEELKAVSTKFAFRFRKNVRHPDRDTTIFYLVLASKSHAALNNMKMAMAQYVQKAGLWGELAYSDYYEVNGLKIEKGRKTSDEFEADIIHELFRGKCHQLGTVKAKILEDTEFPFHSKALKVLEKSGRLCVKARDHDLQTIKRKNKSEIPHAVSHRPFFKDSRRDRYGNKWLMVFS